MAARSRFPRNNLEVGKPDPDDQKQDDCCCPWFKPKSKTKRNNREVGKPDTDDQYYEDWCCPRLERKSKPIWTKPNYKSDAGKLPDNNNNTPGKEKEAYQKEYSNGSNPKPSFYPSSSPPELARNQHDNPNEITYKEADHVSKTNNSATYASIDNQVFAQDQGNSYGKPSSQSKTTSIHGQGPDESPGKIKLSSQSTTTSIHGQGPDESPGKIKPSSQSKTTNILAQGLDESPGKIKPSSQSKTTSILGQGLVESPGKIKPSSQSTTTRILRQGPLGSTDQWEDNRQEGMKKNGNHRGPNSTSETRSGLGYSPFEEHQKSNALLKEEDNNVSHGGTRPDPTKNKGKGNNGSHGGTRSDPSNAFEEAGRPSWMEKGVKHSYVDPLEGQHKGVHKREYNREIHRDTKPDLTEKESSSPEKAGVPKRKGNQKETNRLEGTNTNDEYTDNKQARSRRKEFSTQGYSD